MKNGYLRRITSLLGALFFFLNTLSHAGIPVWSFTPLTPTSIFITPSNTAIVQYTVANNSRRSHNLEMIPIVGITQLTNGAGICGNPFTLTPKGTAGASCTLSLQVNGSALTNSVDDGPVVCQTGSRLECYRPGLLDILHITRSSGASYTVGGSVSGLTGTVVLQNNGSDNLSLSSDGNFVFSTPLASGNTYSVTVSTQPTGQNCAVTNGTGIITNMNITDVTVTCTDLPPWVWMSGANIINQPGNYGTINVPDPANIPGARNLSVSFFNGNLWLFGGAGFNSSVQGYLNDLWQYNMNTNLWTWMKGSDLVDQLGIYSDPDPTINNPGSRQGAISWSRGPNFWLFGGDGFASTGPSGLLNDLWRYSVISGNWVWFSGSDTADTQATYGTQGVPSVSNIPGGRISSVSWVDGVTGNLWLFGGNGLTNSGTPGLLNDLWQYEVGTNEWTWVKGSNTLNTAGTYGIKGTPANGNNPGARVNSVSWVGPDGNYWLFGGEGKDSTGTTGQLNDLWSYNPNTNQWTWISGSNLVDQSGVYGSLGVTTSLNMPGSRSRAIGWADKTDNLYLFGGFGYDSAHALNDLNDLWIYNLTSGQWTWISGSNLIDQTGVYGTITVPSPLNVPGAREFSISWFDANLANLWLFGGSGFDSAGSTGKLNDLWGYLIN